MALKRCRKIVYFLCPGTSFTLEEVKAAMKHTMTQSGFSCVRCVTRSKFVCGFFILVWGILFDSLFVCLFLMLAYIKTYTTGFVYFRSKWSCASDFFMTVVKFLQTLSGISEQHFCSHTCYFSYRKL